MVIAILSMSQACHINNAQKTISDNALSNVDAWGFGQWSHNKLSSIYHMPHHAKNYTNSIRPIVSALFDLEVFFQVERLIRIVIYSVV